MLNETHLILHEDRLELLLILGILSPVKVDSLRPRSRPIRFTVSFVSGKIELPTLCNTIRFALRFLVWIDASFLSNFSKGLMP